MFLDVSEHHVLRRGREHEEHHRGQPGPRHPLLVQRERQLRARGLQTGLPSQLQVSLKDVFTNRKILESRKDRFNRACIELWNSPTLDKCAWLHRIAQESLSYVLLAWSLVSRIEPYLGYTLGVVGKEQKDVFTFLVRKIRSLASYVKQLKNIFY